MKIKKLVSGKGSSRAEHAFIGTKLQFSSPYLHTLALWTQVFDPKRLNLQVSWSEVSCHGKRSAKGNWPSDVGQTLKQEIVLSPEVQNSGGKFHTLEAKWCVGDSWLG